MNFIRLFDRTISFFLNTFVGGNIGKDIILFGAQYLIFIFVILAIFLFIKKASKSVITVILALLISLTMAWAIGHFYQRPRPYITYPQIINHLLVVGTPSFPSGHTISSFAMSFAILFSGFPVLGLIALAISLFIGLSRIAAGVHYPTDVIGGIIFGLIAAWIAKRIIK